MNFLAVNWQPWFQTLGRLHPAVVHFPIALLIVAGLIELWQMIRRRPGASPTAVVCLVLGAISAVVAVALGLIHAHYTGMDGVNTHKWLGVSTAAVAVIVLISLKWNRPGKANPVYRTGVLLCIFLVSATGYFGGDLTYGSGYLTELLWPAPPSSTPSANSWTKP